MRHYLLRLRKKQNMSQHAVAVLAGISQVYYCYIEQGKRQRYMTIDIMRKLAEALGMPTEELFQLEATYQQNLSA